MSKIEENVKKLVNPTQKDITEAVKNVLESVTTIKELNEELKVLAPEDAYMMITDVVHPKSNKVILDAKKKDKEGYQEFQDIKEQSRKSYLRVTKTATIGDIETIASNMLRTYYGIIIRMISKLDDELGKVEATVNTIEKHLGLSMTNFEEVVKYDTTESSNEQGIKETT